MNSSLNNVAYGVTEVFVKHDYYISLRIRLVDSEGYIWKNKSSHAEKTDVRIDTTKKRYPASKILPYETKLHYIYCAKKDFGAFPRYKYILHEGTSRSSKSWSLEEWALRECEENPHTSINIWRDTKEALTGTIWQDFRKLIPLSGRNISLPQQTGTIFFKNGSLIRPKGTDKNNAHGSTADYAWFNEPYGITEEEFDQIDQRANQVIIDLNPLPLHWLKKVKNNPRTKVIYSTFQNNPFCPPEQRAKILSYEPWKSGSYKVHDGTIFYNDKPISLTNQPPPHEFNVRAGTADEYNWMVYGLGLKAEKPKKIYKGWIPTTLQDYQEKTKGLQKYYGLDYGFANPTALVEIAYDGDRTFYVRPMFYKPLNSMGEVPLGEILISLGVPVGQVTYIWADSSDKDVANDVSMTAELRSRYNLNAVPINKPSYKARFEHISKCRIVYVYDENFQMEYDNYEFEIINGYNTEKPIKKNDHYMNAFEYPMWGIKGLLGLAW